jgi:hypothetical protein
LYTSSIVILSSVVIIPPGNIIIPRNDACWVTF